MDATAKTLDLLRQSHLLLELLYDMDCEAIPVEDNYPTGLWWYTGHLDRHGEARPVNNTELCWTREIAKRLDERGFAAQEELHYPGSSQRCDIVWDSGLKPTWVEVKGAWRGIFDQQKPNPSFSKHIHAAAEDLNKLASLSPADASSIIMVLVGFDQANLPIKDDDLRPLFDAIKGVDWISTYTSWHVCKKLEFRVQCWAWARLVK